MRLISFSVFGPDRMYSVGAVENARLAPAVYPGWICRFYVGSGVYQQDASALREMPHVQVIDMDEPDPGDWSGLFWRFLALGDEADAYLFRDADARLYQREADAVEEWLESGKHFHIMRDHPQHWIEILASAWGCDRLGAKQIADLLPQPLWNSQPYVDQWWLRDMVYPVARDSMLVHDSIGHIDGEEHLPFPTERKPAWRFVAQGFKADGSLRIPADALAPVS